MDLDGLLGLLVLLVLLVAIVRIVEVGVQRDCKFREWMSGLVGKLMRIYRRNEDLLLTYNVTSTLRRN